VNAGEQREIETDGGAIVTRDHRARGGSSDPEDIEEAYAEARENYAPTKAEHWSTSAQIATLIIQRLPYSRATSGSPRAQVDPSDHITPHPNPPLTVFGPDGRFIVTFFADGSWVDAAGEQSSTAEFIEGSPGAIADLLIRCAGLERVLQEEHSQQRRSSQHDQVNRGREWREAPEPTRTWRDVVDLPPQQTWDEHTPPSVCRESPTSRLILAAYDPHSCTYAPMDHPRWGVESLRIAAFESASAYRGHRLPIEPIHAGDCLISVGPMSSNSERKLDEDGDLEGDVIWHPQRVLRVESEGDSHYRVWLAVDSDVRTQRQSLDRLGLRCSAFPQSPVVLSKEHAVRVLDFFQLDVFCRECGNRAKPLVYGLPGPDEPDYLAFGGCIIQPDQPLYACSCGHRWGATDF